ncbi:hypothetical protein OOU_Y34scaffold00272g3 [Pyricularia oryzae Y34]|uniref:Uncharacterized protein n=3 Tax=Pyricularia oryzae TaxID=318829 RepID=Q2KFI5_PYRO7|nr:hypothetical protein MGCH7_ch7g700 [Pyricularia oryzae 70-15]ELQ41551.1 hypothetical protein OOU_Y34scaffold00272g3 [Pyricularia oryzae Y34]
MALGWSAGKPRFVSVHRKATRGCDMLSQDPCNDEIPDKILEGKIIMIATG